MRHARLVIIGTTLILAAAHSMRLSAQYQPMQHESGQSVTPSFEGWYENSDGTFNLLFGYMNRNLQEEPDIPIGPNNRIEPGPEDQGQPTHFLPRRQFGVFTVVVPKDFGNSKVTWTIASHGQTISIPGHLRPEWHIDALKEPETGSTPPILKLDPAGQPGQGPRGTSAALKVTVPNPATLNVWVTADGFEKMAQASGPQRAPGPPQRGRAPVLDLVWSKYRGSGRVTFAQAQPHIDNAGKATTTATFSEPGEYTLRVRAGGRNASLLCCWTNGYVKIVASPTAK